MGNASWWVVGLAAYIERCSFVSMNGFMTLPSPPLGRQYEKNEVPSAYGPFFSMMKAFSPVLILAFHMSAKDDVQAAACAATASCRRMEVARCPYRIER